MSDSDTHPDSSAAPADPINVVGELGLPGAGGELSSELNLVDTIIGHRMAQDDIKRVLGKLSADDRDEFTFKLADILRKTSALLEVSKRVSDSLSLDVLLPRMVAIVSEFLKADRCTLFLNDKQSGELYSRVAMGELTEEIRFPNHMGIAGSVYTSDEAVIIADAYSDERFNPEIDRKTGYKTRNILCVPIRTSGGTVIGVAQVLNKIAGERVGPDFDEDDLTLLESITAQAASAFLNAQLMEDIDRARDEESKLLEITTAISRELHLDPLLQKIMAAVTEILDADRSTLFMHDKKTDELWSHVAQGVGIAEIRFPAHLGIAGSVFKSGDTVNIPEAYADERFNPAVDKKTGYKTDTILCMPVINKAGDHIGCVQVLNKSGGPFTELDERRLRAFSAQASIAIENAQLFEEIMAVKNYNESILQSMSNGVMSLDAEGTIVTANSAALRIFRAEGDTTDLLGKTHKDFFGPLNSWVCDSVDKVATEGRADSVLDADLVLRADDDDSGDERRRSKASVNFNAVPLKNTKDEHMGCLLMLEDITSEKRLESTMARYLPKEVTDQLLAGGAQAALGGQLLNATVLFTDIRGFTTISEKLGAQATVKMLNGYFSLMVDCILDNHGILDKYIGDAIMAVFGAPITTPEDPDNAVTTSIAMMRALQTFNAERVAAGDQPVLMGLGINTDEVLSGNIGSLKRMDYTVIGDGVNLAARLESANKAYGTQILISDNTKRLLKNDYQLRYVDKIIVKGKSEPVGVWEVLDYHTEESFPNIEDLLYLYNSGLVYYRRGDFTKAENIFHDAQLLNRKDGLTAMYLDRCKTFIAEPPPSDWDGVWTMTSK